jgi:pimeloyl-ACP methyl ester carboxylesterase
MSETPGGRVVSADGTPIAWFEPSMRAGDRRPVVLVHGTTADHSTWRVFGPLLAASRPTVDVMGHSFGGRCALGAAALAPDAIRRVVSYEGAVAAEVGADQLGLLGPLAATGSWERLLEVFLRDVVHFTDEEWQAFREAPVWPARVAAAPTVIRELRAGGSQTSAWSGYASVSQPVLQVLGSESPAIFRAGAEALHARLAHGRIAVVDGARHGAHHTHPDELLRLVTVFLDATDA